MKGKEFLIPSSTILTRRFANVVTALPMRSEQKQQFDGLTRAKELLRLGVGVNILFNHFSARDPLEVIRLTLDDSIMRKRPVLVPIAFHAYRKWFKLLENALNVELCPIVTQDTIDAGENNDYPLGYGRTEYFEKAIKTLQKGGIVVLAPQTGRREYLGEPERRTVGAFIAQANRRHFDKYAFLFVGLGMKNAEDYKRERVGGLNPFKKYQVKIGPTFTKEEVLEEVKGDLRAVDNWVFQQLGIIVPENYRQRVE